MACKCNDPSSLGDFQTKEAKALWLVAAPAISAYFVGKSHGLLAGVVAFFFSKYLIERTGGKVEKVAEVL